jgi:hypothetical protein
MEELRHALAVKVDSEDAELDWENFASERSLLSCCFGLIIVDEGTSTVTLVHLSLQEYLVTQRETLFPTGHTDIALRCLTYWNFEVFKAPDSVLEELLSKFAFIEHAACNSGHHASEQAEESVDWRAVALLNSANNSHCISTIRCDFLLRTARQ